MLASEPKEIFKVQGIVMKVPMELPNQVDSSAHKPAPVIRSDMLSPERQKAIFGKVKRRVQAKLDGGKRDTGNTKTVQVQALQAEIDEVKKALQMEQDKNMSGAAAEPDATEGHPAATRSPQPRVPQEQAPAGRSASPVPQRWLPGCNPRPAPSALQSEGHTRPRDAR